MRANQRDAVLPFPTTLLTPGSGRAADAAPSARAVQPNSGAGVGAVASASTLEARAPDVVAAGAAKRSSTAQVAENAGASRTSPEFDRRNDIFARVGRWFGNSESVAKYLEIGIRYSLTGGILGGVASAFVLPFFIGPPGVAPGLWIAAGSILAFNAIWRGRQAS